MPANPDGQARDLQKLYQWREAQARQKWANDAQDSWDVKAWDKFFGKK